MPFLNTDEPYLIDIHHDVAAIFKPCGWHSVSHAPGDKSISTWLLEHEDVLPVSEARELTQIKGEVFEEKRDEVDSFLSEGGMLYRLDKDTSGLLLFALSRSTFNTMQTAQKNIALRKRYMLACTESARDMPGSVPKSRHAERTALLDKLYKRQPVEIASYFRSYGPHGARVSCLSSEAEQKSKKKTTKYAYATQYLRARPLCPNDAQIDELPQDAILVEAELRKGFRHQIRAHSAWMGLPILGDALYGDDGVNAKRLFLEAFAVALDSGTDTIAEWKLYDEN